MSQVEVYMSQNLIIGEKKYKFFRDATITASLRACEDASCNPLYMPEQADLWIAYPQLMRGCGRSMSIRATGTTSAVLLSKFTHMFRGNGLNVKIFLISLLKKD